MAHWAKIDENSIVTKVIVAEEYDIKSGVFGDPKDWIQTSYNTIGGIHRFGKEPLRKNFAAIGYTYDKQREAFIPPKPFTSWKLNEFKCLWEPPKERGEKEGNFNWDEETLSWVPPKKYEGDNTYVWNAETESWDLVE